MFRLAALMGRTVAELEASLGAGELAEWVALLDVEPWGDYRGDLLSMAGWSYAVAAPNASDPGKLVEEMRLPWVKESRVRQVSGDDMRKLLLSWGAREVKRGGG